MDIEDNGPGFETKTVRGSGGLGLRSMKERARLIGGTLAITSRPGSGTRIQVRAPLKATRLNPIEFAKGS